MKFSLDTANMQSKFEPGDIFEVFDYDESSSVFVVDSVEEDRVVFTESYTNLITGEDVSRSVEGVKDTSDPLSEFVRIETGGYPVVIFASDSLDRLSSRERSTSSYAGDYGPSNPWNAPGMSIADFI